ncbi:hypothetical protein M378DRAFT_646160 [Amanita muscaria Koide BX008]|uniref:Uncharacterized protein n=1 Tax=Amanita muscaria (strain Koide BX008) TaxID=946122 RepID=A0A0C2X3S6_AMAMK|nr:hypothetical protein M378DRAFT_646160 [Amanita muscaria Koide BX008]
MTIALPREPIHSSRTRISTLHSCRLSHSPPSRSDPISSESSARIFLSAHHMLLIELQRTHDDDVESSQEQYSKQIPINECHCIYFKFPFTRQQRGLESTSQGARRVIFGSQSRVVIALIWSYRPDHLCI